MKFSELQWQIPCGRMYDPIVELTDDLFPCESWAHWELIGRDGLIRYACGSHLNQVMEELIGDTRADITVKDLRT